MSKHLILILILISLVSINGFSQEPVSLGEYSSTISKKRYRIGDSIQIGVANYSKNGFYRYKNVFVSEKGWTGYRIVTKDLSYKKGVISKIYSNKDHQKREFSNSVVFEVSIDSFDNVFIPIEKAITSKEVVVFPNAITSNKHLPFNAQTSVMLIINSKKLNKEDAMLEYVERLEPKKYAEWKNNEFLFESEKEQYIQEVDSVLSLVTIGDTFTLILPVELGDYNFDSNTFPVIQTYTKYGKTVDFPFSKEKFIFSNYSKFSKVHVDKERAEYFAKSMNKSYQGTRSAIVILNVRADKVVETQKEGGLNIGSSLFDVQEFTFHIVDQTCVDSEALQYNFLGGSN